MKKFIKRVAAINDLSTFGKCSLTVIIPILSSMGIEVCPVITAYLSTHTGFEDPVIVDMTDKTEDVFKHIEKLKVGFDCVFTGYISSNTQMEIVKKFIINKKIEGSMILVDPVLGDNGILYSTFNNESIKKMRELSLFADIITPNYTEACLLANYPYSEIAHEKDVEAIIFKLNSFGINNKIIITSVPFSDGSKNIVISEFGSVDIIKCDYVKGEYCGTGDAFSAILCGKLINGEDIKNSVCFAHDFLKEVIAETHKVGGTWEQGIILEKFLNT